ncbi:hypothetical protein CCS01_28050 [Rhodopila globiformis]|uniref:Uncharacterized protein n=2 Tax=Rhodopila globiformis TaxID=1071 RepID=A0A2S6MXU0_RHOGL|nr:hypothetical protein CCS01_28050 [Rhodopila globiformis]
MQVHDAFVRQQTVSIVVDAGPVVPLRNAVATLDALDDVVEVLPERRVIADPGKILELNDVDRLRLAFDPAQSLPDRRMSRFQSP